MLHTASQNGFTFDTVQMPLNVMDVHFNSFEKEVVPVLLRHDIGVLGMKSMGATLAECLHYAMNLPTSVVITGCDSLTILQQTLEAARSFQTMSSSQVAKSSRKNLKGCGGSPVRTL
jgi:hypothetical protein